MKLKSSLLARRALFGLLGVELSPNTLGFVQIFSLSREIWDILFIECPLKLRHRNLLAIVSPRSPVQCLFQVLVRPRRYLL